MMYWLSVTRLACTFISCAMTAAESSALGTLCWPRTCATAAVVKACWRSHGTFCNVSDGNLAKSKWGKTTAYEAHLVPTAEGNLREPSVKIHLGWHPLGVKTSGSGMVFKMSLQNCTSGILVGKGQQCMHLIKLVQKINGFFVRMAHYFGGRTKPNPMCNSNSSQSSHWSGWSGSKCCFCGLVMKPAVMSIAAICCCACGMRERAKDVLRLHGTGCADRAFLLETLSVTFFIQASSASWSMVSRLLEHKFSVKSEAKMSPCWLGVQPSFAIYSWKAIAGPITWAARVLVWTASFMNNANSGGVAQVKKCLAAFKDCTMV